MVKNENSQCGWSQLGTNKLIMNKRILINKNVCRSITFGKCRDVEESKEFLRIELENLRRKERERWNFDFYNDSPFLSDGSDLDENLENEKNDTTKTAKSNSKKSTTTSPTPFTSTRRYQWTKCESLVRS